MKLPCRSSSPDEAAGEEDDESDASDLHAELQQVSVGQANYRR